MIHGCLTYKTCPRSGEMFAIVMHTQEETGFPSPAHFSKSFQTVLTTILHIFQLRYFLRSYHLACILFSEPKNS